MRSVLSAKPQAKLLLKLGGTRARWCSTASSWPRSFCASWPTGPRRSSFSGATGGRSASSALKNSRSVVTPAVGSAASNADYEKSLTFLLQCYKQRHNTIEYI